MKTLTMTALIAALGSARRGTVHLVEHHEMEFGTHWRWNGTGPVYTAAALRLVADAFDAAGDKPGALICRAEANKLDTATAMEVTTARHFAMAAHGEVPGEAEFLAKRWDLKSERDA